jgi:hypothetical protein
MSTSTAIGYSPVLQVLPLFAPGVPPVFFTVASDTPVFFTEPGAAAPNPPNQGPGCRLITVRSLSGNSVLTLFLSVDACYPLVPEAVSQPSVRTRVHIQKLVRMPLCNPVEDFLSDRTFWRRNIYRTFVLACLSMSESASVLQA